MRIAYKSFQNIHFLLALVACGFFMRVFLLSPSESFTEVHFGLGEQSNVTSDFRSDTEDRAISSYQGNKKPLFIILVSSSGRSGSTMMAELLGTQSNSVVFFEPIWKDKKVPCFRNGTCVPKFLFDLANCNYGEEFEEWLRGKGLFLRYFNPLAHRCFETPKEGNGRCRRNLNIREMCQTSSVRIAKLIRSRLSWLEDLLNNDALNVKIIHLIRDPRGSLASLKKMGWNNTPSVQCSNLDSDLKDYNRMVKLYPNQLYRLQLEDVCIDPEETVSDLFTFLFGDRLLPQNTINFLDNHMKSHTSSSAAMNTVKNSSVEFEAWRWEISENDLMNIEREPTCHSSINAMGHVIFGSYRDARNPNISLRMPGKSW